VIDCNGLIVGWGPAGTTGTEAMRLVMESLLHRVFGPIGHRGARQGAFCPTAPEGWCLYAIGDVHGESRCLETLLSVIAADHRQRFGDSGEQPVLVFLGDYVDRGPDSRGVLDILCRLATADAGGHGPACRFLGGNHEAALLDFLADPVAGAEWLSYGGAETLASYGVRASTGIFDPVRCRALRDRLAERLPASHRVFLDRLEPMVTLGDYVFVHAGVRPGVPLERQRREDLQWIREPFLSSQRFHGKVVVHGHTPVDQPQFFSNRIAVDTGAYATGILTAVSLCQTESRVLKAIR
jgi:serine/threonine protein phosphatase 1